MRTSKWIAGFVLLVVFFVFAKGSAQTPPSADVNMALVRELHDLRIAIEKLASANTRVQLLSSRASQQEQRVTSLMNQLITLNGKLEEASAQTAFTTSSLERIQDALRMAGTGDPIALRDQQKALTSELERNRFMQASLQGQVDAVRQQIAFEQSSLSDFQRKLDELDRSITETK